MPSLVRKIVGGCIDKLSDNDIKVMLDDCKYQEQFDLYGDPRIDKPGWLLWKAKLEAEQERRKGLK